MSGKKLFGVYTFLAGILMLAGCTLYMEEPPEIPEAEPGKPRKERLLLYSWRSSGRDRD